MPVATRAAAKSKPKSGALYSVHPGLAYAQAVVAGMKSKTGRSIDEWVTFVKKHGPKTEPEQRDWLRKAHKLGMNYAGWIAGRVHGKGDRITHRIGITSPEEIDDEVRRWMKKAYDATEPVD